MWLYLTKKIQHSVHPLSFPIPATFPTRPILLDLTTRTILGKEYRSFSSSLCNYLHSPVTSSLLGPNTPLNTLFSNILSLRSSVNVSDKVSHPYKTTSKIIVLYISHFLPTRNGFLWALTWSLGSGRSREERGLASRVGAQVQWCFY
jgi:hypothetical protein